MRRARAMSAVVGTQCGIVGGREYSRHQRTAARQAGRQGRQAASRRSGSSLRSGKRAHCKACGRAHAVAPLERPETRAGRARMRVRAISAPKKSRGARGGVGKRAGRRDALAVAPRWLCSRPVARARALGRARAHQGRNESGQPPGTGGARGEGTEGGRTSSSWGQNKNPRRA